MSREPALWSGSLDHLIHHQPDNPVLYMAPGRLAAQARRFLAGFPGQVTYAVKANDRPEVLATLAGTGVDAFDVASPREMAAVREAAPRAALHYNNPVRSRGEIRVAHEFGVRSWAVDSFGELDKLEIEGPEHEVSVRMALPVPGAAYHFGEKFGDTPADAANLLRLVAARGLRPSLTFHPGTQCEDPGAWRAYIRAASDVAHMAGVRLHRLNVGGGFPAHRLGAAPDLEKVFAAIDDAVGEAFGDARPGLVCEPGRAMVADAFELATRVKTLRADGSIFLNDGVYGGLSELRDIGLTDRVRVISPDGTPRAGAPMARRVFGPTCDSLDVLPAPLTLPADIQPEDYVIFSGMGAYSITISTGFNGYGLAQVVSVNELSE